MSVFDLEMLAMYHTSREPMRGICGQHDRAGRQEQGALALADPWLPWGDVPTLGTHMLVITD